jgi:hypothetical protein
MATIRSLRVTIPRVRRFGGTEIIDGFRTVSVGKVLQERREQQDENDRQLGANVRRQSAENARTKAQKSQAKISERNREIATKARTIADSDEEFSMADVVKILRRRMPGACAKLSDRQLQRIAKIARQPRYEEILISLTS